jgi:hypothetical protein
MSIVEFFQQSAGRWMSLKSNHHVDTTQQQSGRSTIEMELLDISDAAVTSLCDKQGHRPEEVTCAAKVKWDGSMEGMTKQDIGSSMLVAIGAPETGQLLRSMGNFGVPAPTGHYRFGDNGEFILVAEDQDVVTTERIWFESENVRLRHTKIQYADGKSVVAFCSEVRMITPQS